MRVAFILLKGFSSTSLLCGGGDETATELLFSLILQKQKCTEICELEVNTSRSDVTSLDKMLVGLGKTFESDYHNVLFLHLASNGKQLIKYFLNPIQVFLEQFPLIHDNRKKSVLEKEGFSFV